MAGSEKIIKDWRYIDKSKRSRNSDFKWTLNDYKWHNNQMSTQRTKNIPHIYIKEMQPDYAFNYGNLLGSIATATGSLSSILKPYEKVLDGLGPKSSLIKNIIGGVSKFAAPGAALAFRNNTTGSEKNNLTGNQIDEGRKQVAELYRDYINSEVLGTYEIPYMGDMYLETVYDGWSQSGADRVYGKTVAKFLDENTPYTSIGVPEWTLESGGVRMPKLNVEFNLYNRTIQDLFKNYTLLHSLSSGALWLQSSQSTKKSPNLFNVSIPGRFAMPFSSITVSVKAQGMIRRLRPGFQSVVVNSSTSENTDVLSNSAGFKALSESIDPQFPDVFNVTLNIQSLLPNNFNSFILFAHGTEDTINAGDGSDWHSPIPQDRTVQDRLSASVSDTFKAVLNIGEDIFESVDEATGGIFTAFFKDVSDLTK